MRLAALIALCVVACTGPKRTSPGALKALDFQQKLTTALDARLAECAQVPKPLVAGTAALYGVARFNLNKAIEQERIVFVEDAAAACLDAIPTTPCEDVRHSLDSLRGPCAKVLRGAVAVDGDCFAAIECKEGLVCSAGSACPGKCTKPNPVGTVCDAKHGCAEGIECVCTDGGCLKRGCRELGKPGADCGTVETPSCEAGYFCPPVGARMASSCQPKIGAGGVCPTSDACKAPLVCVGLVSSKKPGMCKRAVENGEACAVGKGECGASASCVGGKCAAWGGVGSACGYRDEYTGCVSSWCDAKAGTCKAYKKDREACDPSAAMDQCGPGTCDRVALTCVYPCADR